MRPTPRSILVPALLFLAIAPHSASTPLQAMSGTGIGAPQAQAGMPMLRHPGDPLLAWFMVDETSRRAELRDATGRILASADLFFRKNGHPVREAGALFALSLDMLPGDYSVVLVDKVGETRGQSGVSVPVRVEARTFVSEEIALDKANTALRIAPDPKKEAEWLAIKTVYDRIDPEAVLMEGQFGLPAGPARRTAFFGDRRRYLYFGGGTDTTIHTGIDFALAPGTAVLAPARGKVVFAEKRIVTGLTLVLEHLPGMYSVYMHLSAFIVKPGMQVRRGDPIAKSGNTGLSTGPHLHWEIRVAGQPVDPDFFVIHPVPDTLSP